MRFAVTAVRFLKNRDEHRRNVLQEVFRFGTVENLSVLLQLVRDLINDKPTASCECVMGLLEQSALLVDLQNAKRDAGNNIVARVDAASAQFQRQVRSVVVDHMHARIPSKLTLQIARESSVELKEKQSAIRSHPARDLARMHSFAGTVLRDHARLVKIDFIGHAFDQRPGTGYNRCDLERALQESFEEKGAHRKANSHPLAQHCPVASALGRPDSGSLGSSRPKKGLTSILEFIMLWPSEMSCPFSRELVIFPHA